jgi:probable HAF family extracellular repeat protein
MKSRILTCITGMTLFTALAMPVRIVAQEEQLQAEPLQHYTVTDLGTLGGTFSAGYGLNSGGRVGGSSTLTATGVNQHAFLWHHGHMTDLGTLGGPNSIAGGPNGRDELPIEAEASLTDPLGENFCGFGTNLICLGAIWKNGAMTPLPTLGGNNGVALALNNPGQVIGYAENSVRDPSCPSPQVLDFEAVKWGPKQGEIHELRPLPGDTVGFALGINDEGQVVGTSGSCANTPLFPLEVGPHAVLWENGSATDLGNLGGEMINDAASINNRGEVVGASELAGDTNCSLITLAGCTIHPFLWTKETGMQDIGTVGSDVLALPAGMGGINNPGQVVGESCDSTGNCRAFLWQNKKMTDLNTLIPADSPLYLLFAFGINDAGEIAGLALQTSTGDVHAFLATPCDLNYADAACCKDDTEGTDAEGNETTERPRVVLPGIARVLPRRR